MHTTETQISCPECGHHIDVNGILYRQLETELKKKYDQQLHAEQQKLHNEKSALNALRLEIAAKEKSVATQIAEGVASGVTTERASIAKQERAKAQDIAKSSMDALQQELTENTEKLKLLNETQAAVQRLQREKDSLKVTLDAENEQKLNQKLAEERLNIQQQEANRNELKIREKEELINALNKQLTDAQRRAEQGSMQSQGEVQELAVEEWLASQFPHDSIEEIKKGCLLYTSPSPRDS